MAEQVLAAAARIAASGEYVTHAAVVRELARQAGPHAMSGAALYAEPSLALLARLQETVDGFVAAFIDSRAIATVRDLEDELPVVLRSFGLPPLAPPAAAPDPDEIDLEEDDEAEERRREGRGSGAARSAGGHEPDGGGTRGEPGPPTFEEYGLGPLLAHPLVRMHWRLARGARPLRASLSAADVLRLMRDDSIRGQLPADASSEHFGAHLCAAHGVADTRALGVLLRDVRPMLLLARHAWRREQELIALAFNRGGALCAPTEEPRAAARGKRVRVALKPPPQPAINAFLAACERALNLGPRSPSLAQVRAVVAGALSAAAAAPPSASGGAGAGSGGAAHACPADPPGCGALHGAELELSLWVLSEYAMLHLGGKKHRAKRMQVGNGEEGEEPGEEEEAGGGAAEVLGEGAGGSAAPGSEAAGEAAAALDGTLAASAAAAGADDRPRPGDASAGIATNGLGHAAPTHKRARGLEDDSAAAGAGAAAGDGLGRSAAERADGFRMVMERPHGGGPRRISNEQLRPCLPFCPVGRGRGRGPAAREDDGMREAGRWGEALIYQYLLLTHAGARVTWLNEGAESGLGYDLELRQGGKVTYVEVKSSRHAGKNVFQISSREWELARKMGDGYHLYRVYAAMDPALVTVDHIVDPARMLESGQVALCLAV